MLSHHKMCLPLVARRPDDCARNQQAFVCERRRVVLVGHTIVISGAHCFNGLDEKKVCMIVRSEKVRRRFCGLAADFAVVRGCVDFE